MSNSTIDRTEEERPLWRRRAFWIGVQQGLTWPISWPMMWLLYGLGMAGFWFIDHGRDVKWYWWHHVAYRVYQFGTQRSVFWNDMGGFSLWRHVK